MTLQSGHEPMRTNQHEATHQGFPPVTVSDSKSSLNIVISRGFIISVEQKGYQAFIQPIEVNDRDNDLLAEPRASCIMVPLIAWLDFARRRCFSSWELLGLDVLKDFINSAIGSLLGYIFRFFFEHFK